MISTYTTLVRITDKEIFKLNPIGVKNKDVPSGFNIYNKYVHGVLEDSIIISGLQIDMDSPRNSDRKVASAISYDLLEFLTFWGKTKQVLSKLYDEPITMQAEIVDNIRYFDVVNCEDPIKYECNSGTIYKDLKRIVNLKQARDKLANYKGHKSITDNLLCIASFMDEKYALRFLHDYSNTSIQHKVNNSAFKHKYKLIHPDTQIIGLK